MFRPIVGRVLSEKRRLWVLAPSSYCSNSYTCTIARCCMIITYRCSDICPCHSRNLSRVGPVPFCWIFGSQSIPEEDIKQRRLPSTNTANCNWKFAKFYSSQSKF